MMKRIFTLTIAGLLSCLLIGTLAAVSYADYGNYADRLSREHRVASDVDEWIERGNATITASPIFEDGMRLTAWANSHQDADNFEFAIASGVYLFEIPRSAQSIEIRVRYKGEPNKFEINDHYEPIAGRVWIRNIKREATRRGYNDQNASETRYGDTFVLRAKNRSETIKIPAAGRVDDGWMELHVVAEGGEQLDVEYIEVSTYRRAPKVRVVQQYRQSYRWRSWNRYTYLYFYDGPIFYNSGYDSYLCWSYPVYDHRYLSIRSYYGGYLGRYRTYYPTRYSYYHSPYYGSYSYGRITTPAYNKRTQLNRWSAQHESIRKQYSRSRLAVPTRTSDRTQIRNDVRVVIENHRRQAPPSTERVSRSAIISQKQRTAVARSNIQQNDAVRTYSSRSRSSIQTTARQTTGRQRRLILNSRSNVNTSRSKPSSITERSSQYFRRSISSSSRTSSSSRSSSTLRSSSSNDRTKQRSTSVTTSKPTPTQKKSQSVSSTSSSSSRTRPSTTSRSSSSSSSSSSSDDDDDDDSNSRSKTTERIKRRR
jgi:hypothetical protein